MIHQTKCTDGHLWGNIVIRYPANALWDEWPEEPKRYTICLNCGIPKPKDDQGAIMEITAAMRNTTTKKIKCDCPCHKDKNIKHVMACCENGYKIVPDWFPEIKRAIDFHIEENLKIINENVANAEEFYKDGFYTLDTDTGEVKLDKPLE